MIARTYTAAIHGLTPIKIEVEIEANRGIPNLIFIGLATKTVEESKERITSALINCGIKIQSRRTIVNLAPADIRKNSPTFELAIAVGMLKKYQEISLNTDETIFFGELSLNGELKHIKGALPLVIAAKKMGFKRVVLPFANQAEVAIISNIIIHPLKHLSEYLAFAKSHQPLPILNKQKFKPQQPAAGLIDFKDIYDQENAKRALMIAAAGGHNILLVGPPGAGKSMLAQATNSILPPLTEQEAVEVTTIASITDNHLTHLINQRPFRSPHHTISYVGLVGGGNNLKPGEVSLAHRGVLFLDEFTEFNRQCLEALRQPLENKSITLTRAQGNVTYPAAFILIAAANPCPCGWQNSTQKVCRCSQFAVAQYQRKFSGPILDRIDLFVRIKSVDLKKISHATQNKIISSAQLREQVIRTRKLQTAFLSQYGHITNSELSSTQVKKYLQLSSTAKQLLLKASSKLGLTARSYFRLLKVALTIANLEEKNIIQKNHLAEALQYRADNLF